MGELMAVEERRAAPVSVVGLEEALIQGDLRKLSSEERVQYFLRTCESLGLNPLTKPLQYIEMNGKLTLYATRTCTDQLRSLRGVSLDKPQILFEDDLVVVTVTGRDSTGRTDTEVGACPLPRGGEARANAVMKAITKAKRRLTLSLAGLGWLDESEVDSVPGARVLPSTAEGDVADDRPRRRGRSLPPAGDQDDPEGLFAGWRRTLTAATDYETVWGVVEARNAAVEAEVWRRGSHADRDLAGLLDDAWRKVAVTVGRSDPRMVANLVKAYEAVAERFGAGEEEAAQELLQRADGRFEQALAIGRIRDADDSTGRARVREARAAALGDEDWDAGDEASPGELAEDEEFDDAADGETVEEAGDE